MSQAIISTNIKKIVLIGLFIVASTVLIFFIWAFNTQLNSGAIATGKVITAGENKILQHQEGGIIKQILVKEGQKIEKGQKLIVLEPTTIKANLSIYEKEFTALKGLIKRLEAEKDGKDIMVEIINPTDSVKTQLKLFEVRKEALKKDKEILLQREYQTKQEIKSLEYERKALNTMLKSAKESVSISKELYEQRFEEKKKVLDNINKLAKIESDIGRNSAQIHRAEQKIAEIKLQIRKLETSWLNNVLEELSKAQDKIDEIVEKLNVAKERMKRNSITAPTDGIVKYINYKTISGVVPPGGEVIEIVPLNNKLIVEAEIGPNDITSVKIGLNSFVKFTAFNRREVNSFKGKITYVSADTFKDKQNGFTYYKALIELDEKELKKFKTIKLQSGMIAQVEIVTGEKSVMRYLLDPLLDSMKKAMKEK